MKRILITMLISCGLLIGCSEQKNESIKTQRAIPQVQAKNNSITPSENYVFKANTYQGIENTINLLSQDTIIYIKEVDESVNGLTIHNVTLKDMYIVIESSGISSSMREITLKTTTTITSDSPEISIENVDDDTKILSIGPHDSEPGIEVFQFKPDSTDMALSVSKITDQTLIDKIYANCLSSTERPYDAYIGIGGIDYPPAFDADSFDPKQHIVLDFMNYSLASPISGREFNTFILGSYQELDYINIRLVDINMLKQSYQMYSTEDEIEINLKLYFFGSSKLKLKNDSKYTITFPETNGNKTKLLPGQSALVQLDFWEDGNDSSNNIRGLVVQKVESSIEKLNVEDGDRIYVTGITGDYMDKMKQIQNFRFHVDYEIGKNKSFTISISEYSQYCFDYLGNPGVPIETYNGIPYYLEPGKTYNVSVTWEDERSIISISEISK